MIVLISVIGCSSPLNEKSIVEEFIFDNQGKILSNVKPDGSKIVFKYNDRALPKDIILPDDQVRYGYDKNGNRIWMENKTGRTEYKYDALDRIKEIIFRYSPVRTIEYDYDPWGRMHGIIIKQEGHKIYHIKYEYDLLNNIKKIIDGKEIIEFDYDIAHGKVTRRLPNGIKTIYNYSPAGMLKLLKHLSPQNKLIVSYQYSYDHSGRIIRIIEKTLSNTQIVNYHWDINGNLKKLILPDGSIIYYDYDEFGRRSSLSRKNETIGFKYDGFGRLVQSGVTRYGWNENGNLSSYKGKKDSIEFDYTATDMLSEIRARGFKSQFRYDGDGNQIASKIQDDISFYLPNPLTPQGNTLAEFDKHGNLRFTYLYGKGLLGRRNSNGSMNYCLEDGFGRIRNISDIKGRILSHQQMVSARIERRITADRMRSTFDRRIKKAWELIEKGQRLPLPSQSEIEAHDRYWTEGIYNTSDPYYKMIQSLDTAQDIRDIDTFFKVYVSTHFLIANDMVVRPIAALTRGWGSFFVKQTARTVHDLLTNFIESVSSDGTSITKNINEKGLRTYEDIASWSKFAIDINKVLTDNFSTENALFRKFLLKKNTRVVCLAEGSPNGFNWALKAKSIYTVVIGPVQTKSRWFFNWAGFGKDTAPIVFKKAVQKAISKGRDIVSDQISKQTKDNKDNDEDEEKSKIKQDSQRKKKRNKYGLNSWWNNFFCPWCDDGGGPPGGPPPPPPPPGGGGGGIFGDGISSLSFIYDPFEFISAKLGGIDLNAEPFAAENLDIGQLKAVVYDPDRKRLVLVGDKQADFPSIRASDLAEAFLLVHHPKFYGPQFTLDPSDPKNPEGKWLKAVYIPEIIRGTEIGRIMFQTDWLLKQYAFGVEIDDDNRLKERQSGVEDYKSQADISFLANSSTVETKEWIQKLKNKCHNIDIDIGDLYLTDKEQWARIWIEVKDKKVKLYGNDKSIFIEEPMMLIKAKQQVIDPTSKTGLRDIESDNPSAKSFACEFECLYDEIAHESPEFARLKELTKAIVIAKWLKKQDIKLSNEWLQESINKNTRYVDRVPTLSWKKQQRIDNPRPGIRYKINTIHLFGGVDQTVDPIYINDNFKVAKIEYEVKRRLEQNDLERFEFNIGQQEYSGVVISLGKLVKKRKKSRIKYVDGVKYEIGENGKVAKSTLPNGVTVTCSYDTSGRMNKIKFRNNTGWSLNGRKTTSGSNWKLNGPRGNQIEYQYDQSGALKYIYIDGKRTASYHYNNELKNVTIQYPEYTEDFSYDEIGNITEYSVKIRNQDEEKINYTYDDMSNISAIYSTNFGKIDISYIKNTTLPEEIKSQIGSIKYTYNSELGINDIYFPEDRSIHFQYEDNNVEKIIFNSGNNNSEILFDEKNRIAKIEEMAGDTLKFKYTKSDRLDSVVSLNEKDTKFLYDKDNRLSRINFPDGRRIDCEYNNKISQVEDKQPPIQNLKLKEYPAVGRAKPNNKTIKKTIRLNDHISDIIESTGSMKNTLVLDVYQDEKKKVYLNVINPEEAKAREVKNEKAIKIVEAINLLSTTKGRIGNTVKKNIEELHNMIFPLTSSEIRILPDGGEIKVKPRLLIISNMSNYKYANLHKIKMLSNNYKLYIKEQDTPTQEFISNIKNIAKINKNNDNVAFIVSLPDTMSQEVQKEWKALIAKYKSLLEEDKILVEPSKAEFTEFIKKQRDDIVVIEVTHNEDGLVLKNNEKITSSDILHSGKLSINYLLSGLGVCSLTNAEKGKLVSAFRKSGVKVVNASSKPVSSEIAFKRIEMFYEVLKNHKDYKFDIYGDEIIDIIDQMLIKSNDTINNINIEKFNEGHINISKRNFIEDTFFI